MNFKMIFEKCDSLESVSLQMFLRADNQEGPPSPWGYFSEGRVAAGGRWEKPVLGCLPFCVWVVGVFVVINHVQLS